MAPRPKRILIVYQADGYANGVRAVAIERFLRERGHDVQLVDTFHLSRMSGARGSLRTKLPALRTRRNVLYALEALSLATTRRWRYGRKHLSYYLLIADCHVRRSILARSFALDDFDLVICETPHDALLLTIPTTAQTLYDCPTPWADEVFDDGKLTATQHTRLRRFESELFECVDHLAFHWETYARHAIKNYGISGSNLITLNFGCTPSQQRAMFAKPLRIVYIGSLAGRAIDLPLLSRLARLYPHIDVYGGPRPPQRLGLNYLGYADPAVLQQYQLGLITSSQDELRRHGFSAKHPEYLGYGLPVLVPEWREEMHLLRGSVPYNEQTFLSAVEALSDELMWRRLSDEAYAQAGQLSWHEALAPLALLLERLDPVALGVQQRAVSSPSRARQVGEGL